MYTKHALVRMQNRAISPFVVDLLLLYGDEEYDDRGGIRHFFTKKTRKVVRRELGCQIYKHVRHYLDAYAVECDGHIVTVGWRHQGK